MKFYKRLPLDNHNPMSNRFAVKDNGEIITTSAVSLQLPSGITDDRPGDANLPNTSPEEGMIRFNQDLQDMEAYIRGTWERVRTVRPSTIVVQNLGNGNYANDLFGPLNPDYEASYIAGPQNAMVYVDNVYQIPATNYGIQFNPSTITRSVVAESAINSSTIQVSGIYNILEGCTVSASTGTAIASGTTVVRTFSVFTTIPFTATTFHVDISLPTAATLDTSTNVLFSYNTGSYLKFTGAVPAKPVVALLGYDGYFPPS